MPMRIPWPDDSLCCDWLNPPNEQNGAFYAVLGGDEFYAEFGLVRVETETDGRLRMDQSPRVGFYYIETERKGPHPFNILAALAAGEVSGRSKRRLLYDAYWQCLHSSAVLRKWVAEQRPEYWNLISESFPLGTSAEDKDVRS